jgi:membrane protein YdbS with pleckstrin-like domain
VLWLFAAGTCLCYFPKRAAATRWRVTPNGLTVQKGVLFCRALQIRAGQLQGVGRLCSPLGRVFGVETVFLYLPGRVWVLDGVS